MPALDQIQNNTPVRVVSIEAEGDPSLVRQLMHMGLYPGARVRIHQRYPTYVLVADEGTVALEEDAVRRIRVQAIA